MGNAQNTPCRNMFVTIQRVDTRYRETRYFIRADSGRDGWVTEAQIGKTIAFDAVIPLKEAAAHAEVNAAGLRMAINHNRIQGEKIGKDWYTTLAEAYKYKRMRRNTDKKDGAA